MADVIELTMIAFLFYDSFQSNKRTNLLIREIFSIKNELAKKVNKTELAMEETS